MNCFTVLGIEPTTEKKTIKRAYAAKSREFHPEEHPEEFQRIHDAYEEALAWAERNAGREEEPQMPEEPRRMEEESGEDRMEIFRADVRARGRAPVAVLRVDPRIEPAQFLGVRIGLGTFVGRLVVRHEKARSVARHRFARKA